MKKQKEAGPVIVWKLTDANGQSKNQTQWGPGVRHRGTGKGELCSEGWIHYYRSPLLAVLLNPMHADFPSPRLWEAKVSRKQVHEGYLKSGALWLETKKEIELPVVSDIRRVRFAILCAQTVYKDAGWNAWASDWLKGTNRVDAAAARAAWADAAAARAAWADAAAAQAAWAAQAAAAEKPEGLDLPALALLAMEGD